IASCLASLHPFGFLRTASRMMTTIIFVCPPVVSPTDSCAWASGCSLHHRNPTCSAPTSSLALGSNLAISCCRVGRSAVQLLRADWGMLIGPSSHAVPVHMGRRIYSELVLFHACYWTARHPDSCVRSTGVLSRSIGLL
ncbi:unnamed protein product, partial [Mycena citricolor]